MKNGQEEFKEFAYLLYSNLDTYIHMKKGG